MAPWPGTEIIPPTPVTNSTMPPKTALASPFSSCLYYCRRWKTWDSSNTITQLLDIESIALNLSAILYQNSAGWWRLPLTLTVPRPYVGAHASPSKGWPKGPSPFHSPLLLETWESHLFTFTQQLASAVFIDTVKNQLGKQYIYLVTLICFFVNILKLIFCAILFYILCLT